LAHARYPRLQRRKAALQPARAAVPFLRKSITVYALVPGLKVSDAANNTMIDVTPLRCLGETSEVVGVG